MKVGLWRKRHGRKVFSVREDGHSQPRPLHRPREASREARLLALAYRWQRLIDEGQIENQAEIARSMGLTRARVSQIMNLRCLTPVLQEHFLIGLECVLSGGDANSRLVVMAKP